MQLLGVVAQPAEVVGEPGERAGGDRRQRGRARGSDRGIRGEQVQCEVVGREAVDDLVGVVLELVVDDEDPVVEDAVEGGLVRRDGQRVRYRLDDTQRTEVQRAAEPGDDGRPLGDQWVVRQRTLRVAVGGQSRREEQGGPQQVAVPVVTVRQNGPDARLGGHRLSSQAAAKAPQ